MEDKVTTRRHGRLLGLLSLLALAGFLGSDSLAQEASREESGQLSLRKSVQSRDYNGHEVEGEDRRIGPGDSLWRILIQEQGFSDKRFGQYLVLIRRFNPHIKTLDVLKVGDIIFVPLRPDEVLGLQSAAAKKGTSIQVTPGRGTTREYRVKHGEHLYQILRGQLGIVDERKLATYYALVKDLNLQKKNWDVLLEGETIRLPVMGEPAAVAAKKPRPAVKTEAAVAPAVIDLDYARQLPAKENLALLGQIVESLGNEIQRSGQEVLALKDATIRFDKSSYPVVYNPALRQKVIFDPDNQIPSSLRAKLGDPNQPVAVLSLARGESLQEAIHKLLSHMGYQMLPAERPVVVQDGAVVLEAKGNWVALAPEEHNKAQEVFIITLTNSGEDIPQYLRDELSRKGLHVRDIVLPAVSRTPLAPVAGEAQKLTAEIKRWPKDKKEFVDALLLSFGISFGVSESLTAEIRDGFRIDVKTDRIFETKGRRTAVFFQRVEPEITKMLQERQGTYSLELDLAALSGRDIIALLLSEIGEAEVYKEHRFSAAKGANRERLNITAPGFLLSRRGMFLTDREIPQSFQRFFFEKGLQIVYFQ
jgi:hypothetical protein